MTPLTLACIGAWSAMALGVVSGAVLGLGFHRERFVGGYAGWQRRLLRLGHIAWFGLGLLTLAHAGTLAITGSSGRWSVVIAFLVGTLTMPLCCYLAAWRPPWRHAFVLPVSAVSIGIVGTLGEVSRWTSL